MKPHVKAYLKFFGYTTADFIQCEICPAKAVGIHHIEARGMGGSRQADGIENLMALCRSCHENFGDKKQYIAYLKSVHNPKVSQLKEMK